VRTIATALDKLARFIKLFATIIFLASVALNFANIVGRYFLNSPIEWGEEVMLFMMVGMVFFGAVVISAQGRHIRMDLLIAMMPSRIQRFFVGMGIFAEGVVAAIIVWIGIPVIGDLIAFDQRAEASGLPLAIPQAIVPIGMTLIAIICVARLVMLAGGGTIVVTGGE
jgi:TRAP-type C4-dicarboxylate transport system permease small subunit